MKPKICFFATIICLIFPLVLFAETVEVFSDRVQKTYEQSSGITIDFTQKTYVALLEKEVEKKGQALFKKPGKLSINYAGEHGRQYRSDGKTLWIFEIGDSQVQKYPVNDETLPAEALSFLGGLGNLKRDFAVEEVDPKRWAQLKRSKENLQWLELTPLQKRSDLQWLVMGFDAQSHLSQEVFLYTESGNLSHYVFDKIQLNANLPDNFFKYSK